MKKSIMRKGVRILRPSEYEQLRSAIPKLEHKTILDALLYTGMRYIEAQRLQQHPDWFDGDFIHIPEGAILKKEIKNRERAIRLNRSGKEKLPYFFEVEMPCRSGWNQNLKRWAESIGMYADGLCATTTRKTWESWLMFTYPELQALIAMSQGHTISTQFQHYINMPFTDSDALQIKSFVNGWR